MKKETKLVNKVKGLIRKAGLPRWLHRFGPKKYEFLHHAVAYIIKQECKLGYRRVTRLLRWLGFKCPCPSALCTSFKKLPLLIWQRLLAFTINNEPYLIAIDSSGMSRPLPSPYYYKRIDKPYPIEIPLKVSMAVDTRTKKIHSIRLRAKRVHDVRDAKYLIKRLSLKPKWIVADKGYDAEWLHQFCKERGIKACIPIRNYGKPRFHRHSLRRKSVRYYNKRRYGRREIVESVFSAIKRRFGVSLNSNSARTMRAEIYCRSITYNIISFLIGLFERSPFHYQNVFK